VVLGQPDRVEPERLGPGRVVELEAVDVGVAHPPVEVRHLQSEPDVHERLLITAPGRAATPGYRTAPDARRRSTSSDAKPQVRRASRVCWPGAGGGPATAPGVRLNRGAGAGWTTPSTSTKVPRWRLCGCATASSGSSTGATQASVPSKRAH